MEKRRKNPWMDSLRGIACLIVLLAHIVSTNQQYGMYANGCGKIGVWLFCILGAFWFIYPLCKKEKKFCLVGLKNYYLGKFIRLYPSYIVVLVMCLPSGYITDLNNLVKHLFLMEGYGHLWYMPVIVKFFIIAPIFWLLRNIINKDGYLIGIITIIGSAFAVIFPYVNYQENSINLYWYVTLFMMGLVLAIAYTKLEGSNNIWWMDIIAIISVFAMLLFTPLFRQLLWRREPSNYLQNKYLLMGGLWCILVLAIKLGKLCKKILSKCYILQWFGGISYPLYLVHYPIMVLISRGQIPWFLKAIATLVSSMLIAWIIHRIIEEPCKKWFVKKYKLE